MPKEFNFLSQLTGSFGRAAAGNATVAMIEEAYRHHEMNWRYLNCEVSPERLGAAVRGARAMGWAGFNCSLPHKVAVIDHLDGLGDSPAIMRAVNCAVRRGNKYIGENTDGKGFLMSLEGIVDARGKRIVLFGAGGAARAIGVELALAGAHSITVVNRTAERGMELLEVINENTPAKAELFRWQSKYKVQRGADVVINATSIGLYPHVHDRLDVDIDSLRPSMVVRTLFRTHLLPISSKMLKRAVARLLMGSAC